MIAAPGRAMGDGRRRKGGERRCAPALGATLAPQATPIEYGGLGDGDAVTVKADLVPALGGPQLDVADARSRRIWDADLAPLRLAERSRRRRIGARRRFPCRRSKARWIWSVQ